MHQRGTHLQVIIYTYKNLILNIFFNFLKINWQLFLVTNLKIHVLKLLQILFTETVYHHHLV